ncbi:hypothetical protein PRIPAC_82330 [Pristionchus pacificus]|nr:hypothetical protein PRIPAC_82330 [Pristionchus pacificus]
MNMILLLSLITHSGPPPPYSNYDKYQYAPRRVQKTVGAQGVLLCGDEPLVGTNVALVAVATEYTPEEVFATATTDAEGHFEAFGSAWAAPGFKSVVKFAHSCKKSKLLDSRRCLLAVSIPIPDEFVSRASNIDRWFHHRYEIKPTDVSSLRSDSGTCK